MIFNEIKNKTSNYLEFKSDLLIITDNIILGKYANFYEHEGDIYLQTSNIKNKTSMTICNPRSNKKRWVFCPSVIKFFNITTKTNVEIELIDKTDTYLLYRLSV